MSVDEVCCLPKETITRDRMESGTLRGMDVIEGKQKGWDAFYISNVEKQRGLFS